MIHECVTWALNHFFLFTFITIPPTTVTILSSAADLYKQFGSRSGQHFVGPDLDLSCLPLLKELFEKDDIEKNQQTTKNHEKLPSRQRVKESRIETVKCDC